MNYKTDNDEIDLTVPDSTPLDIPLLDESPSVEVTPATANDERLSYRDTWLMLGISDKTLDQLVAEGKLIPTEDVSMSKMHSTFSKEAVLALKGKV